LPLNDGQIDVFCTFDGMFAGKKILTILLILFCFQASAQLFDIGQDPASVKWRIIKTEHFKIIFPRELEKQSNHIANMLEQAYVPLSTPLKSKPVRISVILHNRSVTSNALVPWAPKRMEWYTNPSQDDYPQPWFDQLVVHEFRHVVQYSKIYTGFSKALTYVFGQQATPAILGTFVPLWFVEGDAVCSETAFSNSGRGRMPSFEMGLRSQVLEKGIYNYNKAVFGSYKTYTPDHYVLGYHIVASGQKYFSYNLWESALDRTARLPFMVVPFSSGIHKVSRLYKTDLYKLCLGELQSEWMKQDSAIITTKMVLLSNKENKLYSSYNHGSYIGKNTYLTVKTGMNDITRFIRIDSTGKEKRLFTPGQFMATSLSYAAGKIVWAETASDVRWDNRSYSVIKLYNVRNHHIKQLTHRSRYFAPSLNHSGNRIVCVEQSIYGMSYLTILDAMNGSVLNHMAADTGDYLMTPTWSEDDNEIVFIVLNKSGKHIRVWNQNGKFIDLTRPSFVNIQQPKKWGEYVYYVGAYSGINNIYRIDSSGQIVQITSSRFGVTDPTLSDDGKEIIYSDYTSDGYKLVKAALDSLPKIPFNKVVNTSIKLYESVARDFKPLNFYHKTETCYSSKAYLKFLHLFNFHSWGPLSIDADNTSIKPGLEIISQNLLGTVVTSAGYEHNWRDTYQQFYAKVSLRGLYPQFDFQVNYEMNKKGLEDWNVFSGQVNLKVPFNLSSGKYFRSLQPQVSYLLADYIPRNTESSGGYYQEIIYRIYAYNVINVSARDINPRWGQMIDFRYAHTPMAGGFNLGNIFAMETMLYLPGIGKHHSFNAYLGIQQINEGDGGYLSDLIASPQGISLNGYYQKLTTKLSYEFPLFYPDWSVWSALFIKRFRAALYYDHGFVRDKTHQTYNANSAGVAILSDLHIMGFLAPFSLGCRATYTFFDKTMNYMLVYSVNFNQLYFKPKFSRMND